jgi:hypothetical protein
MAAEHLHEALQDLSRRHKPDLPGAIYHAMGCLDAVARDITGREKVTLGQILKRYPEIAPSPLYTALSQIWGYASNKAAMFRKERYQKKQASQVFSPHPVSPGHCSKMNYMDDPARSSTWRVRCGFALWSASHCGGQSVNLLLCCAAGAQTASTFYGILAPQ